MSRLFWKLFLVVWLSVVALILVLFALDNFFGFRPPEHEADPDKRTFFLDLTMTLVQQGNLSAIAAIAQASPFLDPPIRLDVRPQDDAACNIQQGPSTFTRTVKGGTTCYQIVATSRDIGLGVFDVVGPLLIAALASLISAFWLTSYLAGPILTFKHGLHSLAKGDFKVRIGGKFRGRQDEISKLGMDFDLTAAKLQALQQTEQRLYHDVSHELRSPLSRMQAALGIVRQNPSRLGEILDRMEREIGRLDVLIGEILTLAKLNSDYTMTDERGSTDVIDLLAAIADDAVFEAKAKNVTLNAVMATSFVSSVDGELLYRALENVVRNAIKYSPSGSVVSIDAAIDEHASPRILRIEISDAGPGVPAEDLEIIFEPFARGSDISNVEGHGLGLAIAKQAIELQGGRIWAQNRPKGGLSIFIKMNEGE